MSFVHAIKHKGHAGFGAVEDFRTLATPVHGWSPFVITSPM